MPHPLSNKGTLNTNGKHLGLSHKSPKSFSKFWDKIDDFRSKIRTSDRKFTMDALESLTAAILPALTAEVSVFSTLSEYH